MTLTLTTTALSILLATGSTLHDTFGLLHRNGHILTPARATDTTGHVAGAWTLGDATRIPVAIATLAASMRRSPNRRIGRRAPQERIAHIIIVRFVEGGGDPVICEGWLGVRGTESWTATLALVGEGSARFERVGGNGNAGSGEGRRKGRRERHTHHGSESISGGETREECKQGSRQTAVHAEHERIVTQNSRASSTSSYVEPDYMTARMHEMTFHDDKAGNESSTPHFRAAESSLEVSSGEDGGLQGVGNTMHDSSYHTDQHSYYEDEDGEDDMDELCRRYLQCGYHEELQRVMNAMD